MDLKKLIKEAESEWLDFKKEWHQSNLDLLHDVLCLSNAYSENDRYLILGISDDRKIIGIESDSNRKKQSDLLDFLRNSNLNRIPTIKLGTCTIENHEIDVLIIKNRPDKPFFLLKDKDYRGKTVRAGVVYTRIGDTNIPLKGCAPTDMQELMWREHFGISKPPLKRFEMYINDLKNWEKPNGEEYFYYNVFPEFTIRIGNRSDRPYEEEWATSFPDKNAFSYELEILCHNNLLEKFIFVSCDGGRYQIPQPEIKNENGKSFFFINSNSSKYKISHLFYQWGDDIDNVLNRAGIEIVNGDTYLSQS